MSSNIVQGSLCLKSVAIGEIATTENRLLWLGMRVSSFRSLLLGVHRSVRV